MEAEEKQAVQKEIVSMMMDHYEKGYNDGVQSILEVLTFAVEKMDTYVKV